MMRKTPNTICVRCTTPVELRAMMDDYRAMVNHLLAYGLHYKIGLKSHYYPMRNGQTKPTSIPPERELRDACKTWFLRNYEGVYAVHYLDSAASFAMQHIKSWRSLGGDINHMPHIKKQIARLNNDLYRIVQMTPDGTTKLRITLAPQKCVMVDFKVEHRHFAEWSQDRAGALVILPGGFRLCFNPEMEVIQSKESAAYDFNFERVVIARSDGKIKVVDLSDVMVIQKNMRKKHDSIQHQIPKNLKKQRMLLGKYKEREHNRVRDRLHKKIHGQGNEILAFVGDRHLGVEDLHGTTRDILKDDRGVKFNAKMSSWIHGMFEDIIVHHHADSSLYYTRGTSRFCPFCGSGLTHPTWRESKCPNCGSFDRDRLEAVSGLVRTMLPRHRKGEAWSVVNDATVPKIAKRLAKQSRVTFEPTELVRGLSPVRAGVCSSRVGRPLPRGVERQRPRASVVLHENRSETDELACVQAIAPEMVESGYDANDEVGERTDDSLCSQEQSHPPIQ